MTLKLSSFVPVSCMIEVGWAHRTLTEMSCDSLEMTGTGSAQSVPLPWAFMADLK